MAGKNPYIEQVQAPAARKSFRLTIINEESKETTEFTVNPSQIPYGRVGEPGSIMDLAAGAGVDIEHSCGGVCACATCHVYVTKGGRSCQSATDDEEDMLDTARAVTPESRLSCQCVPNGTEDLVVVIPAWNKNLVKEGHDH